MALFAVQQLWIPLPVTPKYGARLVLSPSWNLGKIQMKQKNYRPISLLCHLFRLFERLILNRLGPITEEHLIQEQAGFRPGKSCTGQVLNLTQPLNTLRMVWEKTNWCCVCWSDSCSCLRHCQPPTTPQQTVWHDKGLPSDKADPTSAGKQTLLCWAGAVFWELN